MVNVFQNGKKGKRLNAEGGQEARSTQREPNFSRSVLPARTCRLEWLHVALDFGGEFVLGNFQFITGLKVHPEDGAVVEIASEAESCFGGYAAFFVDDIGDASDWHA